MPSRMMTPSLMPQETADDDSTSCIATHHDQKRKVCDSPTPSLQSESSIIISSSSSRPTKRARRRVSFDVDENNRLKTTLSTFEKYEGAAAKDVWFTPNELRNILKREGRVVLDLKIAASRTGSSTCDATALKQCINTTFKKCVDGPFAVGDDMVSNAHAIRGLERYVSPILNAHRNLCVRDFLVNQKHDSAASRYQHLSKVSNNFAVVMAKCDEKVALN